MRARDQSSIFSTGRKFRPDYGLVLELHALTLVTHSYAFLVYKREKLVMNKSHAYNSILSKISTKGFP